MKCDACKREAVIFQPYSGKHLCTVHFERDFEAKAKRTIRTQSWLRPRDHIAVAFPGDASSIALLSFLSKLISKRRDIRLSAITLDPGNGKFSDVVGEIAASLGVEWLHQSFEETYGFTREEIASTHEPEEACRLYSALANQLSADIARAHGATRYAIATPVDEIAAGFFSGLLTGSIEQSLFCHGFQDPGKITVITPFMEIPEPEVIRYGELHACGKLPAGFSVQCSAVPLDFREVLESYNSRHPATKFALANLVKILSKTTKKKQLPGSSLRHVRGAAR